MHRCMLLFVVLITLFAPLHRPASAQAGGQSWYVSAGASAGGNGSLAQPFQTIQQAADLTNPGDTVYVMNGTYTASINQESIVVITRSGSSSAKITYTAYPGHRPLLRSRGWTHMSVLGASYIQISGFTIEGYNDSITYQEAYDNRSGSDSRYNTNGIYVRPEAGVYPHHIEIRNNLVTKCPGAGIGVERADYVTIEDNVVHSNSWYTVYATSGISLFHSYDIDSNTGYKNFIRRNLSYNNETYIPWNATGQISDGNGIIIDDNKNLQLVGTPNQQPAYQGRTLVENNITHNNGGSGVHVYSSAHVDVLNNTAYLNSRSPALNFASIDAEASDDVRLLNNILYTRAGEPTNTASGNTNVTYDYNIYYGGLTPAVQGANDRIIDPQFSDAAAGDFRLRLASPAIDSGTSNLAPSDDAGRASRPVGAGIDRGAFEQHYSNLLTNGGLDQNAAGWFCLGTCTVGTTGNPVYAGSQALVTTGRSAAWNGPAQDVTSRLVNGATYKTALRVRLRSGATSATVTLKLVTSAGTSYITLAPSTAVSTGSWTDLRGTAALNWSGSLTAATVFVETASGTDDLFIDSAQLTLNLLNNGDLEAGSASWGCQGCTATGVTSPTYNGAGALRASGRSAAWAGPTQSVGALVQGATYHTSVWVRLGSGSANAYVTLKLVTSTGTTYTRLAPSTAVSASGWTELRGTTTLSWSGTLTSATWFVETASGTDDLIVDSAQLYRQ